MADTEKVEVAEEKKSGGFFSMGSKIPLDAMLLVLVPFAVFVLIFMYFTGLLPPEKLDVELVSATPSEEIETPAPEPVEPTVKPPEPTRVVVDTAEVSESPDTSSVAPVTEGVPEGEAMLQEEGEDEDIPVWVAEADSAMSIEEKMKKVKQLAKVYEQMNAASVAAIVNNMDDDEAVGILSNMKPRSAAKVLASLDPEKAAVISRRLTE
jgi:hypothetical protein